MVRPLYSDTNLWPEETLAMPSNEPMSPTVLLALATTLGWGAVAGADGVGAGSESGSGPDRYVASAPLPAADLPALARPSQVFCEPRCAQPVVCFSTKLNNSYIAMAIAPITTRPAKASAMRCCDPALCIR